jgi:hypothetical protein
VIRNWKKENENLEKKKNENLKSLAVKTLYANEAYNNANNNQPCQLNSVMNAP